MSKHEQPEAAVVGREKFWSEQPERKIKLSLTGATALCECLTPLIKEKTTANICGRCSRPFDPIAVLKRKFNAPKSGKNAR